MVTECCYLIMFVFLHIKVVKVKEAELQRLEQRRLGYITELYYCIILYFII